MNTQSRAVATHTPTPYSIEWRLAYAAGKLNLIPAFGDSIGKNVNKAELALCAKYVAQAKDSHAQLMAALEWTQKILCAYLDAETQAERDYLWKDIEHAHKTNSTALQAAKE